MILFTLRLQLLKPLEQEVIQLGVLQESLLQVQEVDLQQFII